ncbi:unnamed protein product [Polarella glacialis]|uniref:Uncharacterized protein n=1 Tax=Polarella glacialis TaxID=89957 RepID=A0A813J4F1_POLGL|nr:unnamed protein product [Polarella glacialis]
MGARQSAPSQQTVPEAPIERAEDQFILVQEQNADQFVEVQVGDRVLKAVIHGGGDDADVAATTAALAALGTPQFANRTTRAAESYHSKLPDPTVGLKAAEKSKRREISRQKCRDRKGSGDSAEW